MIESLDSIKKEIESRHDNSSVRKTVELLRARCADLRGQIAEQETAATQAFNNADVDAYEMAEARKEGLTSEYNSAMEMLAKQSGMPEISQADYKDYVSRIDAATTAEEKRQGKKIVNLANQILECLNENERLSNDRESALDLLYKCMKERPVMQYAGKSYMYEALRARAEKFQMRAADWISD